MNDEPKAGLKTSEFWAVLVTSLLTILNQALHWDLPDETIATVAGLVASYAIGRGLAKKPV